jgi:hypothetical protein
MPRVMPLAIGHLVLVGVVHGARMEGGDLVVGQIRGDEGLGGEAVGDGADVALVHAELVEPVPVGGEIVAHRGHDHRVAAQQLHGVGDVAGAAAVFPAHVRHQEGHVQDVNLVGQDVVLEVVVEHHDGVVGHGAADQGTHGRLFSVN